MNIYLHPSGVKKELKNIYIGEYKGWTPGSNTVAYFPFVDDQLDKVGSASIQATGTKQTLGYLFNVGTSNIDITNLSANFVSFWIKFGSIKGGGNNQTPQIASPQMFYSYYNVTSSFNQRFAYNNGSWNASNQVTTTSGVWYHFAYGYTGTNIVAYFNGNQIVNVATGRSTTVYEIGYNITETLSELIFESTARTAQEISDYYNQTKSNYGL